MNNINYESIGGLNLYTYCGNDPISKYDPSGQLAITATIGLSTTAYYAIITIFAITTVYIEIETHFIQNSLTSFENSIVDFGEYIETRINNIFREKSINNTTEDSLNTFMFTSLQSEYNFENIYYYKRKKAAPRIKSNSKKKAREKAFLKGGKKPSIHHLNRKYGPHFHPNNPRFSHWHYYYLWLLLFGDNEE